jgi:hypothetical protein
MGSVNRIHCRSQRAEWTVDFSAGEAFMCWYCDHPDRSPHEYLTQLRELIDQYGWAVQGVERDRVRPPWA